MKPTQIFLPGLSRETVREFRDGDLRQPVQVQDVTGDLLAS